MLSQTAEYALRAMIALAVDAPAASSTQKVAERVQVPGAYLAKILQSIRRAGLVTSRRGVGGGIKLARPANKISLLEIVKAVDPMTRKVDAPKGKAGAALAPLNVKVDAIVGHLAKGLAATSLAEVAPKAKAK